jgi:DNA-binding transcriptional MerR regulator/methylmalonyl-CoA mutase cobalamin-binding subunit
MMRDSLHIEDASFPKYSIRAAARMVGVSPVTLRAWERRYRLRAPVRTQGGYRLYSERDVAALRWLRAQAEAGIPLSRAAQRILTALPAESGGLPATDLAGASLPESAQSLAALGDACLERLLTFDRSAAEDMLRLAAHGHSTEAVVGTLIPAVMREVGERWHRGQVTVATEHFVSQFFMRHLMHTLHDVPVRGRPARVLAACAPGELHEIGLLVLAVLLALRGVEVLCLGQDLPLDRLAETLRQVQPHALLFSSTRRETAVALSGLQPVLESIGSPPIAVILGGQGFYDLSPAGVPFGTVVSDGAASTLETILGLLQKEGARRDR